MKKECRELCSYFGPEHHATGKNALEAVDRPRVSLEVGCSVALDEWGRRRWPQAPRWDYLLVTEPGRCLAVEVHHAIPKEVKKLVAKKGWAVERLAEVEIPVHQWWWIPSGKNALGSTGVRHRQLVKAAIRVARGVLDQTQVDATDSMPRRRNRR
jgi:hypothetical protein